MNETDTAELPTGHPNKWNILAIMCTCLVLVVASVSSLNLAIPSIINDLEPSQKQTLWIVDSYALVFAGLLLPAGAIGDRYGRKKALLVGLVIFVLGALWASQSSNPTWLIIARGTTGIGAALTMPATLSILTAVFPRHERFKAVAIWSGFAGAGGAIGIIGGADGPTAIYVAGKLAPQLLGAIAVAAYSYMALVPLIQPPIMRLLTTKKERAIVMEHLRIVSQTEKIIFPLMLLLLVGLFLPDAVPLLGMFCLGNLMKECLVVDRLSHTAQNALLNMITLFLGLSVGTKLAADQFLDTTTLGILLLGIIAFSIGTASGLLMGKLMCKLSGGKINPLIGAAGVSAVPMAARVANKIGLEANPHNFLLMHAMGPNVAGVIGSAIVAGVMIKYLS